MEKVIIKIMEKVLINKKNILQVLIKSNIQDVLTNLVITNWGKGVLQIGAAFLLQIGANAYYKLGHNITSHMISEFALIIFVGMSLS